MSLQSKAFPHPCRRRSVPRRPLRAAPPPSPASDLFPHPEGEIRRYSFPALAIRCERELLEAQQAEDMKEILSNVSASVDAFASLMELMDAEAKVDGVIIHILGRELQRIGKTRTARLSLSARNLPDNRTDCVPTQNSPRQRDCRGLFFFHFPTACRFPCAEGFCAKGFSRVRKKARFRLLPF